jgi:hypothetical protein
MPLRCLSVVYGLHAPANLHGIAGEQRKKEPHHFIALSPGFDLV